MAAILKSAGRWKLIPVLLMALIIVIAADIPAYVAKTKGTEENTSDGGYQAGAKQPGGKGVVITQPVLGCSYYVDRDFKRSIEAAVPADGDNGKIIGGIVPHHLLADTMISSFFASVSEAEPQVVFIVGPNHKRLGSSKIHTGSWNWQTPWGLLEADADKVKGLVESCPAAENFQLLEIEHSVSSLVPYIKYYMPQARIVPLVLHGNLGLEGSRELARKIGDAAGDSKWIVIGSIDFSHYLMPEEADKMDNITLKAIESGDLKAISSMGNDNMDSPPSLMTVLEVVGNRGEYEMKVTGHSNSSRVTGVYSDNNTSYFTILFYSK